MMVQCAAANLAAQRTHSRRGRVLVATFAFDYYDDDDYDDDDDDDDHNDDDDGTAQRRQSRSGRGLLLICNIMIFVYITHNKT